MANEEFQTLKEFINDKFTAHEELESLRFKRIDELISQFGKEIDSNEGTIKRVHSRVDRIEASIKAVKAVGVFVSGTVATFSAWVGISSK